MIVSFANGSSWELLADDDEASDLIARFAAATQCTTHAPQGAAEDRLPIRIRTTGSDAAEENVWWVSPATTDDERAVQLLDLSTRFAASALERGGLLLHGALIERAGKGVILAGHGGAGKSTASRRFPEPWRALCDDQTLVVRDPHGEYRAHPWPTWSLFMWGGKGGSWDVRHSVSLRGIFFLGHATTEEVRPIGQGEAACLASAVAHQAAVDRLLTEPGLDRKRLRRLRFDAVDALVRQVPCYVLRLGLTGPFWSLIEGVLDPREHETR